MNIEELKELKVGPIVFAISMEEAPKDEFDDGLYGQVNFGKSILRLDKDLDPRFLRTTLWHEIVHVIFEQTGIDQDESMVNRIAYALAQVLDDNPQLR
jgi:hypothetical protein